MQKRIEDLERAESTAKASSRKESEHLAEALQQRLAESEETIRNLQEYIDKLKTSYDAILNQDRGESQKIKS